MRTLQELANEAIMCQNGCNMLGLSKGMAAAVQEVAENLRASNQPSDTDTINRHPITKLWASKLHELAGLGMSDSDRYGEAYAECKKLAGVE